MAGSSIALTAVHGDHRQPEHLNRIVVDWVGDDATGAVPTLVLPKVNGELLALITDPGTPAPDDDYDVAITDQHGIDVLFTVGANRDQANAEYAHIVAGAANLHPYVGEWDTLTLAVTGNTVASAEGRVILIWRAILV